MTTIEDTFKQEVEAIQESGVLGAKGRLRKLFDYLAAHSSSNETISENVLAAEVFGKRDFSPSSDDASVRVYIHRLRKKLDSYYADAANSKQLNRLILPRGEYRLLLQESPALNLHQQRKMSNKATILAAGILLNVAIWILLLLFIESRDEPYSDSALSQLLSASERPITILIGDYYMFGQTKPEDGSSILIRDFNVNSPADRVRLYPQADDVGLTYLPPSAAYALSDIIPVVDRTGRSYQILKISSANSNTLTNSDVIYLGLISGMGFIESIAFDGARYNTGRSYDEVNNVETHEHYQSTEALGLMENLTYTDYGYFRFMRPSSNSLVIIVAGTRDTGLRGISNLLVRPEVSEVFNDIESRNSFEVLVEIEGQQQANIGMTVIDAR